MGNDAGYDDVHQPGTPAGMEPGDVEARTAIGQWFGKELWPASREELRSGARDHGAPEEVLTLLQRLPEKTFQNTQEVVDALGIGVEQRRQ